MLDFIPYQCSIDCMEVDRDLEILNCSIKNDINLARIGLNKLVDIEYNIHDFIVIVCRDN